jgi:hypothetical protein
MSRIRTVKLSLVAIIIFGYGQALAQNSGITMPFEPNDLLFATKPGKGTIIGQAFVRKANGGTDTAAMKKVLLFPRSRYVDEVISKFKGEMWRNPDIANLDNRLGSFVRFTIADAGGAFQFTNVPDGPYLVLTAVDEQVPALLMGYNVQTHSLIGAATVKKGGIAKVNFD